MSLFRPYRTWITVGLAAITLAILCNAVLAYALHMQRQADIHQLSHQLDRVTDVDDALLTTLLEPYGFFLEPPQHAYVDPVSVVISTGNEHQEIFGSPLWLSKSHWFIIGNALLAYMCWQVVNLLRRKRISQKSKVPSLEKTEQAPMSASILGLNHLYQSVFAIAHCTKLSVAANGVASLLETLLQESLSYQQQLSVKVLNTGSFAITIHDIHYQHLDKQLEALSDTILQSCRALLPELRAAEVKVGICNYRSGADQAIVYQLTQSALALAKQSKDKHCYRIPFSHNHSMLLAAKSCSLSESVQKDHFICFFQPVFDLHSEQILHHETLLRVRHQQLGLISPEYLEEPQTRKAESSVDSAVLARLDKMLATEVQQGDVSINLQQSSWFDGEFWQRLTLFLEQHRNVLIECKAELLEQHQYIVRRRVRRTKACQRGIIIDQLRTWPNVDLDKLAVPVQAIKLAPELIAHIEVDKNVQKRVLAYVAKAQQHNIPIIAVGVERQQQVLVLQQLGVRAAQGAYFSGALQLSTFKSL